MQTTAAAPVVAIVLLSRGEICEVHDLNPDDTVANLAPSVVSPSDPSLPDCMFSAQRAEPSKTRQSDWTYQLSNVRLLSASWEPFGDPALLRRLLQDKLAES